MSNQTRLLGKTAIIAAAAVVFLVAGNSMLTTFVAGVFAGCAFVFAALIIMYRIRHGTLDD